ncbi:MAG: hypothetical protein AAGJ29_03835 [Pseudomonadota bacterium]
MAYKQDPPTGPVDPAPFTGVRQGIRTLSRQTFAIIGLALIILSVPIGFLTPFLPIGLPMGIAGAALLARNAVWGQRLIGWMLRRHPRLERLSPNWLIRMILKRDKRAEP